MSAIAARALESGGHAGMVKWLRRKLPKLQTRVRFPVPASRPSRLSRSMEPSAATGDPALADRGDRISVWLLRFGFVLALCVLLAWVGDGLTFFGDEWDIVLRDPGWTAHSLLDPLNEHIQLAPVVIYKLAFWLFG